MYIKKSSSKPLSRANHKILAFVVAKQIVWTSVVAVKQTFLKPLLRCHLEVKIGSNFGTEKTLELN
jgi:hypothetical protein